jgi:uncharacterized protein
MFIKELWRYPIKSMAGERVRESSITLAGIPGDRAISVVDPADESSPRPLIIDC